MSEVSFNGHADVRELTQFAKGLAPKDIILVHGAKQQCEDLKKHLKATGLYKVSCCCCCCRCCCCGGGGGGGGGVVVVVGRRVVVL